MYPYAISILLDKPIYWTVLLVNYPQIIEKQGITEKWMIFFEDFFANNY